MKPLGDPDLEDRAARTFELIDLSEALMLQNLRRRYPNENEAQIEQRFVAWLQNRPGAEQGDASGPFRVRCLDL